ncbi:MAG TPA: (Fe-S)-binding protein [Thermodesulfobacteriota bacterium]|nr:(Fe-S)-binding protein [Thermodesulfobacteriota bacterium]
MSFNNNVSLFLTCLVDNMYPNVGTSMVKVLRRAGAHNINIPENQTCCGQPAYNSGYQSEAKEIAIKFLDDFKDSEYIVCPSGSCVSMIKVFYKDLFKNDDNYSDIANVISHNTYELSDFIINILGVSNIGAMYRGKVTYHDSCHALRELGISGQPRELLKNVDGLQLIEMDMHDACCGFGGTFSVKYPDVSTAMLKEKVQCIIDSGADTIVSTDMGCLMNIQGYISRNNISIKVHHIAEILAITD